MKLLMYGINRDTVSSDDIHKYSLDNPTKSQHLRDIHSFTGVREVVVLTTENRNEYYLLVDEKLFNHGDLLRYLSDYTGKMLEEIILETYSKFNDDVVEHLLKVSSSIESSEKSTEIIDAVGDSLMKSNRENTVGKILNSLFNKVLAFTLDLSKKRSLNPILQNKVSRSVRLIEETFFKNYSIDYLVVGGNPVINHIMKHFIGHTDSTVTFIDRNKQTKQTVNNLKKWLKITNQSQLIKNIYTIDLNQFLFRLSKADVIIIGESTQNAWISESLLQEMYDIRPSAKKQLFFDFSACQDESLFSNYKDLDYKHIDDEPKKMFPEEIVEEANTLYDELLTDYTNQFMDLFMQMQERSNWELVQTTSKDRQMFDYTKNLCRNA